MAAHSSELTPLVIHASTKVLSDQEFFELCRMNPEWRIEQTAGGDVVMMPPTGGRTGRRNFDLTGQFSSWVKTDASGVGFDSSTGFRLPSGAKRSPDIAWVRKSRWEALADQEQEEFPPLCPDFVVDLRSRSDALAPLVEKMTEYIANGVQLGWLIDPVERKVHVYRPGAAPECLSAPVTLSGDPLLPGFVLDLRSIWS